MSPLQLDSDEVVTGFLRDYLYEWGGPISTNSMITNTVPIGSSPAARCRRTSEADDHLSSVENRLQSIRDAARANFDQTVQKLSLNLSTAI